MVTQFSTECRNAALNAVETTIGTGPTLQIRTGAPPANTAAADTGSLLATMTLPSDWMAAASGGSKALAGTWQVNASGTGTPGHYRIKQGGTTHLQGTCGVAVPMTTNGATASNSNVLNFAATTGVQVGHLVTGSGVPSDTYVLAVTATTVTLSRGCPSGVANGASITFRPDMVLDSATVTAPQQVTVTAFALGAGGA